MTGDRKENKIKREEKTGLALMEKRRKNESDNRSRESIRELWNGKDDV